MKCTSCGKEFTCSGNLTPECLKQKECSCSICYFKNIPINMRQIITCADIMDKSIIVEMLLEAF